VSFLKVQQLGENMTTWFPTFSAVIGLLFGGVITYMTSRAQLRIQAEREYDVALRDMRLPHYQELFRLTGAIPREWWPSSNLTRREVLALRERFHDWYFGEGAGGLFLSQDARTAYSELQFELQEAARNLASDEDYMRDPDIPRVSEKGSALRHRLSSDLGAAEQARQGWTLPSSPPHPRSPTESSQAS
jgi:hypothetical protein